MDINRLSAETIESNKQEFIGLLRTITRKGAEIEKLISKLEMSDFFSEPASTKYHGAYIGGLCVHCLNVYYNMMHLLSYKAPRFGIEDIEPYKESVIILALCHDISKMNLYKLGSRNVKVYSPDGDKYDELRNFYWKPELSYELKPVEERFVYGNHEATSEYMIRHYIPLTVEESSAILHHMGNMSWDSAKDDIGAVFSKYPLALLLYLADMMSTYVDEKQ